MLTPIFLNLENYFVASQPPAMIENPVALSEPQYYLLIHPPRTANQVNQLPVSPIRVSIPNIGHLSRKVRLQLAPSVGYGVNSCYRVEYWEWRKPIVAEDVVLTSMPKISKTRVKEEYWWVPSPDGDFFYDYPALFNYKPKYRRVQQLELTRQAAPADNLNPYPDLIEIVNIRSLQAEIEYSGYNLVETAGNLILDWSNATVAPEVEQNYVITYVQSILHKEMVFDAAPQSKLTLSGYFCS